MPDTAPEYWYSEAADDAIDASESDEPLGKRGLRKGSSARDNESDIRK